MAAHSHAVSRLVLNFYDKLEKGTWKDGIERYKALRLAILHDEDEGISGDTPSIVKDEPTGGKMARYEWVVRFCDLLEAWYFISEERLCPQDEWVRDNVRDRLWRFIGSINLSSEESDVVDAMLMEAKCQT